VQEVVAECLTLLSAPQRCPTSVMSATWYALTQHTENERRVQTSLSPPHTQKS